MTAALAVTVVKMAALGGAEEDAWAGMVAADPALSSPLFNPMYLQAAAKVAPGA